MSTIKKNNPLKLWNPAPESLEQLRQEELDLVVDDESETTSDLAAEQELDFESVEVREYEPEVWEVENDATEAPDESY